MNEAFDEADIINEEDVVYEEDGISIPLLRKHAVKFRYNECACLKGDQGLGCLQLSASICMIRMMASNCVQQHMAAAVKVSHLHNL